MPAPLVVGLERLKEHLTAVEAILQGCVDVSAQVKLELDDAGDPLVAGIEGAGCERASRNRGPDGSVAPWVDIGGGLWAWLGYREEWGVRPAGANPTFTFRASSITIHFGFKAADPKPQMFRAEWAGPVLLGGQYVMQGGQAAHPHWQFDAIESLILPAAAERASVFAEIIRAEREQAGPKEFAISAVEKEEVRDVVAGRSLAAIHFASAAAWWRAPPHGTHAHVPAAAHELRAWLQQTLNYVALELDRV